MADSSVPITAGSGTNIDTRTEGSNSNHRQVVVLGDPATNAGVAPVNVTAGLKVNLGADNDVTVTGAALTALQLIDNPVAVLGTALYTEATTSGFIIGVVRNDVLATLADTDNEIAPLQVDPDGALYVTGSVEHDTEDDGAPHKIGGRSQEPTAQLEEVADNDRADGAFDRQGRLAVWNGYPVQTAIINDSTSGNNTIQAAAGSGLRIAVMGYHIVSDGTTDVRWEDGAGGTAFTGQIPLQAREGLSVGYGFSPMWVGAANVLLNLELTANVVVHGQVSFIVMTD